MLRLQSGRCLTRCGRPRGTGRPSCGWWALQCQGAVTTEGLLWIGPEGVDMSWYELTVPQTHAWARKLIVLCCIALCPDLQGGWTPTHTVTLEPGILGRVGKCQVVGCPTRQLFRRRGSVNPTGLCTWELGSTEVISVAMKNPSRFEKHDKNLKRISKVQSDHATHEYEMQLRQECWVLTWGASFCLKVQVRSGKQISQCCSVWLRPEDCAPSLTCLGTCWNLCSGYEEHQWHRPHMSGFNLQIL